MLRGAADFAPGVPEIAEHTFMKELVTTYGKTWHTWQIDRYPNLPTGKHVHVEAGAQAVVGNV